MAVQNPVAPRLFTAVVVAGLVMLFQPRHADAKQPEARPGLFQGNLNVQLRLKYAGTQRGLALMSGRPNVSRQLQDGCHVNAGRRGANIASRPCRDVLNC